MSTDRLEKLEKVAAAALRLRDEPHHITMEADGWFIEHTLSCRADFKMNCDIDKGMRGVADPGLRGRFSISVADGEVQYGLPSLAFDPAKEILAALAALDTKEEGECRA